MSSRITVSAVKALAPGATLWDRDVPGFGVRRQRRDPVYVLKARVHGRIRWFTIGKHGTPWTPDSARRQARVLLGQIAQGEDPARARALRAEALTIAELVARFLEEHAAPKLKPRTALEYRRLFERFLLPALGHRPAPTITRADMAELHHRLHATPRQANFLLAATRKLFAWAESRELRVPETNPCRHVEKFPERGSERYLSPAEMERLGEALLAAEDRESPFAVAAIRLLAATGARRGEILGLLWTQVDLDRGVLLLPDSKTGARTIYLSPQATAILEGIPRLEGNPYVIAGQKPGGHLVGIGRIWRRIAAEAGLDDVRLHDLRHSFASAAIADGVPLATIGALLGHRRADTTSRYAHLAADPVRAAGNRVAGLIAERLDGVRAGRSRDGR